MDATKHTIISLKRTRSDGELHDDSTKGDGGPPTLVRDDVATPRPLTTTSILQRWGPSAPLQGQSESLSANGHGPAPSAGSGCASSTSTNRAVGLFMSQHVAPAVDAATCFLRRFPSDERVLVIDVETTGFQSDRCIVEIAAVELRGTTRTGVTFHRLINAERSAYVDRVSMGDMDPPPLAHHPMARKCHAITAADESNSEDASVVMREFVRFCTGGTWSAAADGCAANTTLLWPCIVAHNARFDVPTINAHLTHHLHLQAAQLIPTAIDHRSIARQAVTPLGQSDHGESPWQRQTMCTMQLFRCLYPTQRASGLDHVAHFFGVKGAVDRDLAGHHGALIDANITARIFQALVSIVAD